MKKSVPVALVCGVLASDKLAKSALRMLRTRSTLAVAALICSCVPSTRSTDTPEIPLSRILLVRSLFKRSM